MHPHLPGGGNACNAWNALCGRPNTLDHHRRRSGADTARLFRQGKVDLSHGASLVPTSLDNDRRSPKKLLRSFVARLLGRQS